MQCSAKKRGLSNANKPKRYMKEVGALMKSNDNVNSVKSVLNKFIKCYEEAHA